MKITPKTLSIVLTEGFDRNSVVAPAYSVLIETPHVQWPAVLEQAIQVLRDNKLMVGFAESCTGGLLSSLMSAQAGVSDIFWGSVVSYSNNCKNFFLEVDESIFKTVGAVSAECALQMSEGLVKAMGNSILSADLASTKKVESVNSKVSVSITGIAGPTGGSDLKPVGTVFIAVSGFGLASQVFHHEFISPSHGLLSRKLIQEAAVLMALKHLIQFIETRAT